MLAMLLVGNSEELRFGTVQAPHAVEWLSDNGSPFTGFFVFIDNGGGTANANSMSLSRAQSR